jgi:hypothetical protein
MKLSHSPKDRLCWNIHIYIQFASDISAFWAPCHIAPFLYSSLYLYYQVKERNETVTFPFITSAINCCRRYIRGYRTIA